MARRSLRTRLVVLCVVLVAGAIAATAAIVSLSTTASIRQQYRQDIAGDAAVYDALLGYAATHSSWTGMSTARLRKIDHAAGRITITDQKRHVLATSSASPAAPAKNAQPAAVVDPLAPDPTLSHAPQQGGIDARAQGPFALTGAERKSIEAAATTMAKCLATFGYTDVHVRHYPNGRAYVLKGGAPARFGLPPDRCIAVAVTASPSTPLHTLPDSSTPPVYEATPSNELPLWPCCGPLERPTAREVAAARQLTALFRSCLRSAGLGLPNGYPAVDRVDFLPTLTTLSMKPAAQTCLASARRTQLADYVAPPVLLFLSGTVATHLRPGLSSAAIDRIIVAATIILIAAVAAVLFAANGVSRPLRTLTEAVVGLRANRQPLRVSASGTKEIAALTDAFNDMSTQLAAADAQRKDMISDVAHELRTPLANIRGWLEAAHDGLARPDGPFVDSLLEESRLLQSIIDDLQVLALADAGRLVIEPVPTDLGEVLDQVVSAQQPAAAAKGLRLELARHGELTVPGSPERLRQAIGNLLANAIRYTDDGSVTLTANGAPGEVVVDVTDTGRGISAVDLPHIFDRFWRAEKSRDRRGGGSGLGLSIADRLVAAHGGRIDAYSSLGVGTTMRVRLPRQPA